MGLALVVLLGLQSGYGVWRIRQVSTAMQQASSLRLALVQTNVDMYEKRQRLHRDERLDMQMALSQTTLARQPDMILWPESMYPYALPVQRQDVPLPPLPGHPPVYWLMGALTYDRQDAQQQVFNSALLVDPEGRILGRYDKQVLLAFGEYIPLQRYFPFLRQISPTIGNLTPGRGGIVTLPSGVGIGPLICYEDIISGPARQAVRQGARLLVNLTNDVWFGPTRAPYQHRALAAFRSVENRVYLVRVTNTGLTSVIDALGRERAVLPLFVRDTLVYDVQPLHLPTLYTRFGDWFAYLCCAVALCLSLWAWRRQRRLVGVKT
jgi:apolipoprotein N-acyltransferase